MIVLDTNLVSEGLRAHPEPSVMRWLESIPHRRRRITVITVAELLQGVIVLPRGARRERLHLGVERVLASFASQVLDVDSGSAPYFADIRTSRRRAGRPIDASDAWIAAVCRRHDVPLATRNVKDFEGAGIALINPWDAT